VDDGSTDRTLAIARRLAAAAGTDLASAWAYGDAWADRFLLGGVGHPVAVRPGRRLRRFAVMSGWEMIDADAA